MIAAIRFNAFFVGVERHDNPRLADRPFAVTLPGRLQMTTLLACSAEAVQKGLLPGQLLSEAQASCAELAHVHARLPRYAEVSLRLMDILRTISPQLEVVALDEAYLDLTSCQSYYRHRPENIARLIHQELQSAFPLSLGIGISGDRATATFAAKQSAQEAAGFLVVPPERAESTLAPVPLSTFCDLGPELLAFLQAHDIHCCGDVKKLPVSALQQRFGALGTQFWLMAQGRDPRPVQIIPSPAAHALQVGKLMPAGTRDAVTVLLQLHGLCEKLALQLAKRSEPLMEFTFSLRCDQGWRQARCQLPQPTHDAQIIFLMAKKFLRQHWLGETVLQLRVQAHPLALPPGQPDIFPMRALKGESRRGAVVRSH